MATAGSYFYIEPENITLEMHYSGMTTVSSGWIYLDTTIFPDYYTSNAFDLIADNNSTGENVTMNITITSNGVDEVATISGNSVGIHSEHIITRFKVEATGTKNNSSGTVILNYISEQIYFQYDSAKLPIIYITSISTNKISAIDGFDECIVKFYSDLTLEECEARATTPRQTIGHGSGLLVEEVGGMYAGVIYSASIVNEELTNGDNDYTISIFGKTSGGVWSDG